MVNIDSNHDDIPPIYNAADIQYFSHSFSIMTTVANLLAAPKSEWYTFYTSIDSLIKDYHANSLRDWNMIDFLTQAHSYLKNLPEPTKDKLFTLLLDFLLSLKLKDRPDRVACILNLIIKTKFHQKYAQHISALSRKYISQLNVLEKKERNSIFWPALVMVAENAPRRYQPDLLSTIYRTEMTYYTDEESDTFWMNIILQVWRRFRLKYSHRRNQIDIWVRSFINKVFETTVTLEKENIRRVVYIRYVRYLSDPTYFNGLYHSFNKTEICPYKYVFYIPKSNQTRITIRAQRDISYQLKTFSRKIISDSYERFQLFQKSIDKTSNKVPINDCKITMTVFDNETEYKNMAPLWNLDTDSSGETINDHFLTSSLRNGNSSQYEALVYQELNVIRNLGPQFIHICTLAWLNSTHHVPPWFLEGFTNTLGNEHCYAEAYNYIKKRSSDYTVKRIVNLDYSDGVALHHWGSLLFRYIYEEHRYLLNELVTDIQNLCLVSSYTFNSIVLKNLNETDFQYFIQIDQQICHEFDPDSYPKQLCMLKEIKDLIIQGKVTNLLQNIRTDMINTRLENNNTLLHYVVNASNLDMIWRLLLPGSRLDLKNNDHKTPQEIDPHNKNLMRYIADSKVALELENETSLFKPRENLEFDYSLIDHSNNNTTTDLLPFNTKSNSSITNFTSSPHSIKLLGFLFPLAFLIIFIMIVFIYKKIKKTKYSRCIQNKKNVT